MKHRIRTPIEIEIAGWKLACMADGALDTGLSIDDLFEIGARAILDNETAMDAPAREAARMRAICEVSGYTDYRLFASGRDACIACFGYTFAILADMTIGGYGERWCYARLDGARKALEGWNGELDSEPDGWHRHPTSGRRRPDGNAALEYIAL